MNDDIEIRLKEALKKTPTADNLNAIGDLYLKKGDQEMANHYFHNAVSLLNFVQKDKIVAIYKKIISHSPDDIKAYEGLLKILLRTGLVVDELKYLTILARLYEEKGDVEKAYFSYRRLSELSPDNVQAKEFLKKWNQPISNGTARARERTGESESPAALVVPREKDSGHSEPAEEETTAAVTIKGRAHIGLFSASLEESIPAQPKPQPLSRQPAAERRYLLPAIAALGSLILFIAAGTFMYKKLSGPAVSDDRQVASHKVTLEAVKEVTIDNYHITVARVSEDSMGESGLGKIVAERDLRNNFFYAVTVQPSKGCLPSDFVSSPHNFVVLTGKEIGKTTFEGNGKMDQLNRVIYRTNICGGDSAAVFIRFFVYHSTNVHVTGMELNGLGQNSPMRIAWEE